MVEGNCQDGVVPEVGRLPDPPDKVAHGKWRCVFDVDVRDLDMPLVER
jgi:hypothetical protein